MSFLRGHIVLMALYAFCVSVFFALLWKTGTRDRILFALWVFLALFVGGIAVGWAMFPFPR